jgi:hypothetical protein
MSEEDWQSLYNELSRGRRNALERDWTTLRKAIDQSGLSWATSGDFRRYLEEERGVESTNKLRTAVMAFNAFREVYQPPTGTGDSIAFYQLEADRLDDFASELGLKPRSPVNYRSGVDQHIQSSYGSWTSDEEL